MNIKEILLYENRLALSKGDYTRSLNYYPSLLCVMHPKHFLELTTDDHMFNHIENNMYFDTKTYDPKKVGVLPFLNIIFETGKVIGHEGRHRAMMVHKENGTSYPCIIYFYSKELYYVRGEKIHFDSYESEEISYGPYEDITDAEEKIKELSIDEESQNSYYYRTFIDRKHPLHYRGHPKRSNERHYKYSKFTKYDVPEYFESQFTNKTIPTKNFKFGKMKTTGHMWLD